MGTGFGFLGQAAEVVAPRLLGCLLVRDLDGRRLIGRIVEAEAYSQQDAASHSYRGQTPRTEVMFGPPGFVYVYFTYGMHYCMNVVTGATGEGSAVLIRALEPVEGIEQMTINRGARATPLQLTNGPAKLCQALQIGPEYNGHDLAEPPLQLVLEPSVSPENIIQTTRVGITRDMHRPWRFYLRDNPYVSKP